MHTDCQAFAWAYMGACESASSVDPSRLPGLVLHAPPSESSATPLTECMYACDGAHRGSMAGLSMVAHPTVKLLSERVSAPVSRLRLWTQVDSPALVLDAPPSDSSTTRLSECLYVYDGA